MKRPSELDYLEEETESLISDLNFFIDWQEQQKEECKKMPMGHPFDSNAEDMIKTSKKKTKKSASKAKKYKPNEVYTDLEFKKNPTWEEVFAEIIENPLNTASIDSFMTNLVENYNSPTRKSAW